MKRIIFIIVLVYSCLQFAISQINYYIDFTNGNDSFEGTSKLNPLKTMGKVNELDLNPGDSVFFKRGEMWRIPLIPKSGNFANHIYYGAYGTGNLPLLTNSRNMNLVSNWGNLSGNFWLCKDTFDRDVGNIIFDNESHAGIKKWDVYDLQKQDDFYYDIESQSLVVYSSDNPALIHSEIECAIRYDIVFYGYKSYITFENFALKYGAGHGFGGQNTTNITVRNCEISWIGGGKLFEDPNDTTRYGNGIEFLNFAFNNLVENNKIWEIYDTGVTNQSPDYSIQQNITYRNNIISNCGLAALEIWNIPNKSVTKNIRFENNTCVDMSIGWSEQRPDTSGAILGEYYNNSEMQQIYIRNNIFVNPNRFFFVISDDESFLSFNIDHNCYVIDSLKQFYFYNFVNSNYQNFLDFDDYKQKTNNDKNSIFVDPEFVDYANHDYHLKSTSPCIDAGETIYNPYDYDGVIRPQQSAIDIGAYEYNKNNNGKTGSEDQNILVYPNPSAGALNLFLPDDYYNNSVAYIFDMYGNIMYNSVITERLINIEYLKTGMYILLIQGYMGSYSQKIVVKY